MLYTKFLYRIGNTEKGLDLKNIGGIEKKLTPVPKKYGIFVCLYFNNTKKKYTTKIIQLHLKILVVPTKYGILRFEFRKYQ